MFGGPTCGKLGGWGAVAVLLCAWSTSLFCEDLSHRALFEESSFDRWQLEGRRVQVPWKVQVFPARLSLHQRLEAGIEIHLPVRELAARREHGRIVLLVQVTDANRRHYRTAHILDLNSVPPDATPGDVPFSWGMFVLPGEYQIAVALNDKVSGEHNFHESTLHVATLENDPLPNAWQGLPSVEFHSPGVGRLDRLYRAEVKGSLNLPLVTKKPLHLEVLADLTPSETFNGDPAQYERFLGGVLPIVKVLSQMKPSRGSVSVSALDLERKRVTVEQLNLDALIWSPWKASLGTGSASLVPIRSLAERQHTPIFLRDEIVRRMETAADAPAPAGNPVVVFVIVGGPMDSYSLPDLAPIHMPGDAAYVVFYLQYDVQGKVESRLASGGAKRLEKMLKPLHVKTFTVRSAESIRHALAAILEEVSRM